MSTHVLSIPLLALSLGLLTPVSAQDQPGTSKDGGAELNAFVGTWERDAARTKFGGFTISFEQFGDKIRFTSLLGAYTFNIDGTDYATGVPGETVSWKQIDKHTLESTAKRNGKIEAVSTRVFSPDGKTASMTISRTRKVNGDKPSNITVSLERQSGSSEGNPLLGTWKQRRIPSEAVTVTYTLVPQGLSVRYDGPLADQYTLVFDGKEHAGGAGTPNVIARKITERSFEERWTREGKVVSISTVVVSANGQELTEQQQPGNVQSEPSTIIYHRTK